jgi:hypothetical protein
LNGYLDFNGFGYEKLLLVGMHQLGATNSKCCEDLQQVVFLSKPAALYGFYKNQEKRA